MTGPRRAWPWLLAALALAAVRLALTAGDGVTAYPDASLDDRLFIELARHLAAGAWMGPYDAMTLTKAPFYPMWIAAAYRAGVPLLWAQHLLYAAACALAVLALLPLGLGPRWGLGAFALLLFNPITFDPEVATQISRAGLYPALALLAAACAVGLWLRHDRAPYALAPWAAGLGLACAAFWLTREEGVWLLPAVALLVGWTAARAVRDPAATARSRAAKLALCLLPAALWGAGPAGVAQVNRARYGVRVVNEIQGPAFTAAYGALLRAAHGEAPGRVPVPAATRARLYGVSPAFAELAPMLEGAPGRRWMTQGCREGARCTDIGGSAFLWAFRQAAAEAGHHASAPEAARYYRRIAAEVNGACADGRLACGPPRATLRPPWRWDQAVPVLATSGRVAAAIARFRATEKRQSPTYGSEAEQALFRTLTRDRSAPPRRYLAIAAWGLSPRGAVEVTVRGPDGGAVPAAVTRLPTPEAYRLARARGLNDPRLKEAGIRIETPCLTGCVLEVGAGGAALAEVPIHPGSPPLVTPDLTFQVGSTRVTAVRPPDTTPTGVLVARVRRALTLLYQAVMPVLAALALGAYAVRTAGHLRRRRLPPAWVVATALLIGLAARVVVLALIEVTSFPTTLTPYLCPAHPLLLLFILLAGTDAVRGWRGRAAGPGPVPGGGAGAG